MRLCLDEHYSPQIAVELREAGFDVTSIKERPDLVGMPDAELLAAVTADRRALLTENVRDVRPLVDTLAAEGQSHYGVVFTAHRTMPRSTQTIGMYVRALTGLLARFPGDDDFRNAVEWLQRP